MRYNSEALRAQHVGHVSAILDSRQVGSYKLELTGSIDVVVVVEEEVEDKVVEEHMWKDLLTLKQ